VVFWLLVIFVEFSGFRYWTEQGIKIISEAQTGLKQPT
jgi:hypothetical protein